jgi:hypothetical protein
MLVRADRYGHGVRGERADRFVQEQSTHGALLDPRVDLDAIFADPDQRSALQQGPLPLPLIEEGELPTTVTQLRDLMHRWTGELFATARTRVLLDAAVQLHGVPPRPRAAIRPFVLATLATIPDEWHEILAPGERRVEEHLAAQAIQTPMALLRLLVGRSPAVDIALARTARRS